MSYIINDILSAMNYLPIGIICGFLGTTMHYILKSKVVNKKTCILEFFLITYLTAVLFIALLSREPGSRDMVSLIPFSTFGTTPQSHAYVVENIIMFIPFGFLLPLLWVRMNNLYFCLLTAFFTSLAIEVTQVITKMGYGQTDDVITNVLGAAVGFGILRIIQKVK
ncbi:hypothetical protein GCM10008910_23010 [Faecalicatena orotica]|uniref:VanZ family protein n=1 Tax=Faecalicatena orotica TaxID=1544 RepID=UPI0031D94F40